MNNRDLPTAPVARIRSYFWLRLLALIFLVLAVMGWVRFEEAIRLWNLLISLGLLPGPLYLALTGALWGLIGVAPAVGLWFGYRWATLWSAAAALIYPLTYWIDRLWIAQRAEGFPNEVFALGVTVAWMVFSGIVLARFRKRWV